MGHFLILLGLSYLLGSIPFGLLVAKIFKAPDPRGLGSGNLGAANLYRLLGPVAGLLTLLGDTLKGAIPALLALHQLSPGPWHEAAVALVAAAAVLGHVFPLYLGFKGGKGVATAVGVLFGFNIWLALAAIATWLFMAFVVKISSLSAIVACVMVPVYAYFIVHPSSPYFGTCIIIAILVIHRHKSNLIKLLTGQEGKIGEKTAGGSDKQA